MIEFFRVITSVEMNVQDQGFVISICAILSLFCFYMEYPFEEPAAPFSLLLSIALQLELG